MTHDTITRKDTSRTLIITHVRTTLLLESHKRKSVKPMIQRTKPEEFIRQQVKAKQILSAVVPKKKHGRRKHAPPQKMIIWYGGVATVAS